MENYKLEILLTVKDGTASIKFGEILSRFILEKAQKGEWVDINSVDSFIITRVDE